MISRALKNLARDSSNQPKNSKSLKRTLGLEKSKMMNTTRKK